VVDTVTTEVNGWVQPTLGRIKTRTRVLDLGNRWGFPGTKFKNGTETVSSWSKLWGPKPVDHLQQGRVLAIIPTRRTVEKGMEMARKRRFEDDLEWEIWQ